MLRFGHFGKWMRNTWKVLKCGDGEGWRKSIGSCEKLRSINEYPKYNKVEEGTHLA
jgi:hypothetical protein